MLWRFPLVVALVISLALAQLLPFLDLVAHSQRETGYADTRWSMPGWGWVNFLMPMAFGSTHTEGIFFQHGQYWTSSYYLGIATLWLALLAVLGLHELWIKIRGDQPIRLIGDFKRSFQCAAGFCSERVWILSVVAAIALICALGENTPIYPLLRKLIPQLSFITYPVKYVTLAVFVAPLLAGFALIRLEQLPRRIVFSGIVLFTLLVTIGFWTWAYPFPGDDVRATLLNGLSRLLFLAVTGGLLLVLTRESKPGLRRLAPLILIVIAWLDVFTHEPAQNPTVSPSVYEPNLARASLKMNPQPSPGQSRVMVSPKAEGVFVSFAMRDPKDNFLAKRLGYCANCNLLDGVPKVDGFFSLTPRESDDVLSLFYTIPQGGTDYPRLEDFMGVSQITAPDEVFHWQRRPTFLPLITAGQKPVFLDNANTLRALTQPDFDGGKIVYLPPEARSLVKATNQTSIRVISSTFTQQQVDVEVESTQPSLVVFSQTYYHNWQAAVDGRPAPLLRANHAFQAVSIPAGRHNVRVEYKDRLFEIGAVISAVAWLGCLIGLRLLRRAPPVRQTGAIRAGSTGLTHPHMISRTGGHIVWSPAFARRPEPSRLFAGRNSKP
jgi:hypothetical protein